MNGYLLDTNIILIGLTNPEHLSAPILKALARGPVYLSVLSYWEVVLKSIKGKLDVGQPRIWWDCAIDRLAAIPLLLQPSHIATIYDLEPIHPDPFDRALMAQAIIESLTLLTIDQAIVRYSSARLRVLS